jgi:hypothetical protein
MSEEYLLEHVLGLKRDQQGLCNFPHQHDETLVLMVAAKAEGASTLVRKYDIFIAENNIELRVSY